MSPLLLLRHPRINKKQKLWSEKRRKMETRRSLKPVGHISFWRQEGSTTVPVSLEAEGLKFSRRSLGSCDLLGRRGFCSVPSGQRRGAVCQEVDCSEQKLTGDRSFYFRHPGAAEVLQAVHLAPSQETLDDWWLRSSQASVCSGHAPFRSSLEQS